MCHNSGTISWTNNLSLMKGYTISMSAHTKFNRVHAAEDNVNSITFFGIVERVYSFFSSSTHQWDISQAFAKESETNSANSLECPK